MGFFTVEMFENLILITMRSQSLSGWDGVFHERGGYQFDESPLGCRNPFQGGMGFFTGPEEARGLRAAYSRNPFQGGMGFFTP